MKELFKNAFYNGTMRDFTFSVGAFLLILAFLFVPLFYDIPVLASVSISFMLTGFLLEIITYLLPSPKLHRPAPRFSKGTDSYLEQSPEEFTSEQREALLQESWMVQADRFLRIRKF